MENKQQIEKKDKIAAALVSFILIFTVILPAKENWSDEPKDGFPLSYYPMFTKKRKETQKIIHALGVDPAGNTSLIKYRLAGTGGLNQVRRQIKKTVKEGGSDRLCLQVASNLAKKDKESYEDIVEIRIVTSTYHLSDYFTKEQKVPISKKIHHSCRVERG